MSAGFHCGGCGQLVVPGRLLLAHEVVLLDDGRVRWTEHLISPQAPAGPRVVVHECATAPGAARPLTLAAFRG